MSDYRPTVDQLRANWQWGGREWKDPAEFNRTIEQVRAEAKREALMEAAAEFERLSALGKVPSGEISDEDRAAFWTFWDAPKADWLRRQAAKQ